MGNAEGNPGRDGTTAGTMATAKVVVVTGAGGGIGGAAAALFAREGADMVVVADANTDAAHEVADGIVAAGFAAMAATVDVTDEGSVAALFDTTVERFGRIDAAVNTAGISGTMTPLVDLDADAWDQMLAVNLTGIYRCLRHELRHMVPRGTGAIVNTSSGAGLVGVPGLAHYAAAKHGVLGLTKSAALEYARSGVRVNAVCPGTTDTPMIRSFVGSDERAARMVGNSVGRGTMGDPAEVAEAMVWLCSDRASFVNGESMVVDGATVCR